MKTKYYLLICLLTTFGINVSAQTGHINKRMFEIPNSKLSLYKPTNYQFFPELFRIQSDQDKFVQISELVGANYLEGKEKLLQKIKGTNAQVTHNLKINNYDAILIVSPQEVKQITQNLLLFGDENLTVMVVGISPINDKLSQKEIQEILLSVNYNNNIKFKEPLLPFTINLKESKYKLAKVLSGLAFFTVGGKGSPFGDELINNFSVQVFPSNFPLIEMENYSKKFVNDLSNNNFKEKNVKIISQNSKTYTESKDKLYETIVNSEYKGKNHQMILILKSTEDKTILFLGTDLEGNNIEIFKDIFKTIKLK
ncbi:hypothetical protein NZD85_03790 [Empedobacter stercoris]|uniref:hypothetical protein n=1 Tax=Empedobacter TaxID=59734 RepID=UPI001D6B3BFE|nr:MULTISPECIES: hypothetical protein [Empedobacter]MDM1523747.1 hypothetical protein [Empedobacter sp. 225-1]MDM1543691.1 hypothetical protein [Empedobacter sp. 189-2]UWX67738.1 hypothetical protein NZD85_03790 [Empedobacter stercoris]HJD86224.1 hypothetical protein [Empedobacter falsenii]